MHFGAIWGDIYTRFIFLIALFLTSQTAATSEKPCTAGLTRVPAYKIGIVHDPSNWKSRRALHWIKYAATNPNIEPINILLTLIKPKLFVRISLNQEKKEINARARITPGIA